MKACIYARTCRAERLHDTTSIDNQIAFCRDIASQYNLTVEDEHVFTDVEKSGALMPSCWSTGDEESRPALSEMIAAIEDREVSRVIVRRAEKLGTSSAVLLALVDLFTHRDIYITVTPEQLSEDLDPRGAFATSILRPRMLAGGDLDAERRERVRTKKLEEIRRLQARIARLESELAEM
jgi:DNA invertase Pin-like site-specific DNA recombinase